MNGLSILDAIAGAAARGCAAPQARIYLVEGDVLRLVGRHGRSAVTPVVPVDRASVPGRAVLTRKALQGPDGPVTARRRPARPAASTRATAGGSLLAVPLLRDGAALGVVVVRRPGRRPFEAHAVALLEALADVALDSARLSRENTRLSGGLQARARDLTAALDRQTATAEILRAISHARTDVQPVFEAIADSAMRLFGAWSVLVFRHEDGLLRLAAARGGLPGSSESFMKQYHEPRRPWDDTPPGRSVLTREVQHVVDVDTDPSWGPRLREDASARGFRSVVAVPMLRGDDVVGAIAVTRDMAGGFAPPEIAVLETFADQAAIALGNARLLTELERRNRDLSEMLEEQTATNDILRVISSSPTDVGPVFDAIARRARRLCDAEFCGVLGFDGRLIHFLTQDGLTDEQAEAWRRAFPMAPDRRSVSGRAVASGGVEQIADVHADPEFGYRAVASMIRSLAGVPMLREGVPIGVINVARPQAGHLPARQVALLQTFAAQAVIAIENVRLLSEVRARTAELTRSVERLTALEEVGRAVSSTLDLDTVLTTIVARAVQLAGVEAGAIYEYDAGAEGFQLRATQNLPPEFLEIARPITLRKEEGVTGRIAESREPVQIPDITAPDAYEGRLRDVLLRFGHRAVLAVPLVSEDRVVGGLVVTREQPGDFAPEVIDLLKAFGTQSALAIENARLYREVEDKGRQLEAASRHKSEFLANMSHELRTPLNAIIGFSEVLQERMFGELNDRQVEYLGDILESGRHLLSLINDILDLSKVEAGRMELQLAAFDLPAAIDNALALVRERAGRHGIALEQTIDPGLGEIVADERKIRQILLNLLSNAIKFTPEGGRISLRATRTDGGMRIAVSDTGVGIAPEDQALVFEEFRQVGGDTARKSEGTGLGLALTRKFVELHGGHIGVTSRVGQGSTFTFSLPIDPGC